MQTVAALKRLGAKKLVAFELCPSSGIITSRWMRWAGHLARIGEKRNAYKLLVGKPEGERPLGRPRRRWMDNIRIILERWDGVMWTGLVWLRIETGGAVTILWNNQVAVDEMCEQCSTNGGEVERV
jgi:hypothetical protein